MLLLGLVSILWIAGSLEAGAHQSSPPALAPRLYPAAALEDRGSLLRGVAISCSLLDVSIASRESSAARCLESVLFCVHTCCLECYEDFCSPPPCCRGLYMLGGWYHSHACLFCLRRASTACAAKWSQLARRIVLEVARRESFTAISHADFATRGQSRACNIGYNSRGR